MENKTRVITGLVRFSYAHVFEKSSVNGGTEQYSAALLIPKSDKSTLENIKKAIQAAKEEGKDKKFNGKIPAKMKEPLRDGDEEHPDDENYAGHYFVNANNKNRKPKLVDANLNEILDPEEFYSGCFGRAAISFYAFNSNGNRGIACSLENIQKIKDGEPLSGGQVAPEADFGDDFSLAESEGDFLE